MNAHAEIKQDKQIKQMTIDCAELLAALKWVNIVTPARATIPVISQAKFEVSGERLTISTTDLDIEASETLACNAKGRWAFVANGVRLVKLLRGLSGPVAFEVDTKKQKLTLSVEGITLRANLMSPPEDFPTSMLGNSSKPMGKVKISEATLHHALKLLTQFSICTHPTCND